MLLICNITDIQSMLELNERYWNKKTKLCNLAFEEKDTKTEFQLMLEEKYTEFDVKVIVTYE